jgi:hypothetical protein
VVDERAGGWDVVLEGAVYSWRGWGPRGMRTWMEMLVRYLHTFDASAVFPSFLPSISLQSTASQIVPRARTQESMGANSRVNLSAEDAEALEG